MTPEERSVLLDSLLDGDIGEAEFLRIEAELAIDEDVRKEYYRRLQLDALLEQEASEQKQREILPPEHRRLQVSSRRNTVWLVGVFAAIAASWLLIVSMKPQVSDSERSAAVIDQEQEPSASGFAVLAGQSGAVWGGTQLDSGGLLPEGELHLKSGLIHVELFSGVQMVIQGDAVFSIDSPMQVTLMRGRARANVPEPAHGFRVNTASGDVVDLGTEFAIDVDGDRASVQVVDGEVELHPHGTQTRRLKSGRMLSLTKDGLSDRESGDLSIPGPSGFQDELAELQSNQFQEWQQSSQALRSDPRLVAHYQVDGQDGWSRRLENLVAKNRTPVIDGGQVSSVAGDGAIVAAKRTEDRWGRNESALDFSQMGSRVRVTVPGEHRGISMFCWVKINSLDRWYNSLFLTDGHEDREPHWQIMNDGRIFFSVKSPSDFDTPEGNRKNRIYYSPSFWNASLSGRWIMLAAVYNVDQREVVHYVNGEAISREPIPEPFLIESIKIGAASICNWSEPMYRTDPTFVVRNLNGSLDEFALFSGALSSEEIMTLFRNGSPNE